MCSHHCSSCKGTHLHPCFPHILLTSWQLQQCNQFSGHKIRNTGNVHKFLNQNALNVISPVGGRMFFTKMKIAFSGLSLILFRTTYTNWPTVRSAGTKYLLIPKFQINFHLKNNNKIMENVKYIS